MAQSNDDQAAREEAIAKRMRAAEAQRRAREEQVEKDRQAAAAAKNDK